MDWSTLEEKCRDLLKDPSIRKQDSELKYLVIDYTQFDEWSSEEELLAQNNGIGEKQYLNVTGPLPHKKLTTSYASTPCNQFLILF